MGKNKFFKKSILILILVLIILTSLRIAWLAYHTSNHTLIAEDGFIDLSEYNVDEIRQLNISEGWDFKPGLIYNADTLHNDEVIQNGNHNYGSYYLTILLNDEVDTDDIFSLSIPSSATASSLYVNGELIAQSGVVSNEPVEHLGKGTPYLASFTTNTNELNFVVNTSNFDTTDGASLNSPIYFGTSESLLQKRNLEQFLLLIIIVILSLFSIYSLVIYLFINRKFIFLLFSIGFLFPAIDELLMYNSSVLSILNLNYEWSYKVKEFAYLGSVFFLVQIMKSILREERTYKRFYMLNVLYLICSIIIFISPLQLLSQISVSFFVLYFLSFAIVMPMALKEYFHYRDESIFIAIILVGTTSGIIWGVVKAVFSLDIPFYPFDYFLVFLAFSMFWFKRFARKNNEVLSLVEKLKQKDKAKEEFLVNTSYALQKPLHSLLNIVYTTLDNNVHLTSKLRENLGLIANIGERMSYTLNNLEDFAKLNDSKIKLNPEPVSLYSVSSSIIDIMMFMLENKNLKFEMNIPKNLPYIHADPNRLSQVLFALLHNSVRFSKDGVIKLSANSNKGNNFVYISVEDQGQGMEEETIKKIFNPYEDSDVENKLSNGVGMGLKVCKLLIELHGGEISVQSVPGQGSVFTFSLPISSISNLNEQNSTDTDSNYVQESAITVPDYLYQDSESDKPCILIVQNDPAEFRVLKEMLSDDYHVFSAYSGLDVLKKLKSKNWDLLISDVMLTEMSGYELTKEVRKKYSLVELPILLLTNMATPQEVYTGFKYGANDHVARPLVRLEFTARVKVLIQLKNSLKEQMKMEAAWLQAQIQPHFLFNTLNTIASLSDIDNDRMLRLLDEFSNYLRHSFDVHHTREMIPLKAELALTKSYLHIENERFGTRVRVDWKLDDLDHIYIPPLSVQTLVENAIKHGILKKKEGGHIQIQVMRKDDFAEIVIHDNGVGIEENKLNALKNNENSLKRGIGLINTNRRLKQYFGQELSIKSQVNQGTRVSFKVPIQRLKN
ncbi:ATP-binding protein [Jeotgalibacillus haloalkalitolerans]|nr:ATP-binding protein [Jeotgalibacillus sp. HH7-29]